MSLRASPLVCAAMGYVCCTNNNIRNHSNGNSSSSSREAIRLQCDECGALVVMVRATAMTATVADRMAIALLQRMKEAHSARCTFNHVDPDTVMSHIYSSNSGVRGTMEEREARTAAAEMLDTVVQMVQRLIQIGWHQQQHHDTDKSSGSSPSEDTDWKPAVAIGDTTDVETETTVSLLSDEYLQWRQQQNDCESLVDEVCRYLAESTVISTADDVAQQLSLFRSCVHIALFCWEMKRQPPSPTITTSSSSPSSALLRTCLVLYCPHCMMDLIISKRTQRNVDPHLHHRWWCPCVSPGIEQESTADDSSTVDPTAVWREQILDAMVQRVRTLHHRETGLIEDSTAEFITDTSQYSDRDEYEVWRSVRDILSDSLSPGFLKRREIRQELLRDRDQQSLADEPTTESPGEGSKETEVSAVERSNVSQTEKDGEEEAEGCVDGKTLDSNDAKEEASQLLQSNVENEDEKWKEEKAEAGDIINVEDMADDTEDDDDVMDGTTMEKSLSSENVMDAVEHRDKSMATTGESVVEVHEISPNKSTRIDRNLLEPATATATTPTPTAALAVSISNAESESAPQLAGPSQEENVEAVSAPPSRVITLRKLSDAERMKRIMKRRTEGVLTDTRAGNLSGTSSSGSNNGETAVQEERPTETVSSSSSTATVRDTPNTTARKPAAGIGATRRGKRRLPRVAGSSVGNSKRRKRAPVSKKKKQQRNK